MKFEEFVRKIEQETTAYTFGDMRMYEMMNTVYGSGDIDTMKLASMIWLIGRSYAASPERIHKKEKSPERIHKKEKDPADLFVELAESIKELLSKEILRRDEEYQFDGSDQDIEKLICRTCLVKKMNNVRLGIFTDGKAVNMISFCSKLLHFWMPKTVFIVDQYSLNGSNRLFAKIRKRTSGYSVQEGITIEDIRRSMPEEYCKMYDRVRKKMEIEFTSKLSESDRKVIEKYCVHTCRCYVLASYIKSMGIEMDTERGSMPRLVDSVLFKVGNAAEAD